MMWSAEYRIGNAQIDSQHKQMILTLEELMVTLKAPPSEDQKKIFEETTKFLKNYVMVHFNTEELYQSAIGFTEVETHRKMHKEFIDKMRTMEIDLIRTDYEAAEVKKLADYLLRWLIGHIMKEDKKMGDPTYQSEDHKTAEFLL